VFLFSASSDDGNNVVRKKYNINAILSDSFKANVDPNLYMFNKMVNV